MGPQSSPPQQQLRSNVPPPASRSLESFRTSEGLNPDRASAGDRPPLQGADRRSADDRGEEGRPEQPFWATSTSGVAGNWGRSDSGPNPLPRWMVDSRPPEQERGGGPRGREEQGLRGFEGAASPPTNSGQELARLLVIDARGVLPEREGARHGPESGAERKGSEPMRMPGDARRLKSEASGMLRGQGGERRPSEAGGPSNRGGARDMGLGAGNFGPSDGQGSMGMSMENMRAAYEAMNAQRDGGGGYCPS